MKVKELITELLEYDVEDEVIISIHTLCNEDEDPDIYHYKLKKDDLDSDIKFGELTLMIDCNEAVKQKY